MPDQVLLDHRVEQSLLVLGEHAGGPEDVADRPRLVVGPLGHGRGELVAGDEPHLDGQGAEQDVAVGVGEYHLIFDNSYAKFFGKHVGATFYSVH